MVGFPHRFGLRYSQLFNTNIVIVIIVIIID